MLKYILIAGVNGAGKSTLFHMSKDMAGMPRINTDEIVKSFGDWKNPSDVIKAGKISVNRLNELISVNETFNQETTLCGKTIFKNIERARAKGYRIELHYVSVDTVEIAKERVKARILEGGHGVPDEDIERRYQESLFNLARVIKECDIVVLYDNTVSFRRFAIFRNGNLFNLSHEVPHWYRKIENRLCKEPSDYTE